MRIAPTSALMASVLLAASCTTGPSEYSDPASPINVKRGEEFVIVLESNATTGYRWTLSADLDTSVVRLLKAEYKAGSSSGLVGAGGLEYWHFGAEGGGTTLIPMAYVRAGSPVDRTAIFTVKVK